MSDRDLLAALLVSPGVPLRPMDPVSWHGWADRIIAAGWAPPATPPRRRSTLTGRFLETAEDVRDHLAAVIDQQLYRQEAIDTPTAIADAVILEVHHLIKVLSDATPTHPHDGLRQRLLTLFTAPPQASQPSPMPYMEGHEQ